MPSISKLYEQAITKTRISIKNLTPNNFFESGEIKCRLKIDPPKKCSAKIVNVNFVYGKLVDGNLADVHERPMHVLSAHIRTPAPIRTTDSSDLKICTCSTPNPCYGDFSFCFILNYKLGYRQWWTMPIQFRSPETKFYKSSIFPRRAQGVGSIIGLDGLPREGEIIIVLGLNDLATCQMVLTNTSVEDLVIEDITAEDGTTPVPGMPGGAFSAENFGFQGLPVFPVTLHCSESLSFTICFYSTYGSTAKLVIKTSRSDITVEMYGKIFYI